MRRATSGDREVGVPEAAEMLAMTQQAIGQWAEKAPPELVKLKRGRKYLVWPGFPIWYRQRLQESRSKPTDLVDAQKRKLSAEAELAELELERERGQTVTVEAFREQVQQVATTLRAQLLSVPGRYAPRTAGLATLPESQRAWDAAIRDVLTELADGDRPG